MDFVLAAWIGAAAGRAAGAASLANQPEAVIARQTYVIKTVVDVLIDAAAQLLADALQGHAHRGTVAAEPLGDLFGIEIFKIAQLD